MSMYAEHAGITLIMRRKFRFLFVLSMVLAIVSFILSGAEIKESFIEANPLQEIVRGVREFLLGHGLESTSYHKLLKDDWGVLGSMIESIGNRLHPVPSFSKAAVQIFSVLAITYLWFIAIRFEKGLARLRFERPREIADDRENKANDGYRQKLGYLKKQIFSGWMKIRSLLDNPIYLSLIPAFIFVVSMEQAYQPAVFVMALVAIFVAAEHYSGLQLQGDALIKGLGQLERIKNSTQIRLKGDGLKIFVQDVYRAYYKAKTIYAVVRVHDIDEVWWTYADENDPWAAYFDRERSDDDSLTFYQSLVYSDAASPRTLTAHFVSDFPLPGSQEWEANLRDGTLFKDIMGLAWEIEVINEAKKHVAQPENLGAWVSRPLCWMHATDEKVFQIIRRKKLSDSFVSTIANTGPPQTEDDDLDLDRSRDLVEWAQDDIRRYIDRGCSAEEYLFSILRYAALKTNVGNERDLLGQNWSSSEQPDSDLVGMMNVLGFAKWRQKPEKDRKRERLCIQVFERVLRNRSSIEWRSRSESSASYEPTIAYEIL